MLIADCDTVIEDWVEVAGGCDAVTDAIDEGATDFDELDMVDAGLEQAVSNIIKPTVIIRIQSIRLILGSLCALFLDPAK